MTFEIHAEAQGHDEDLYCTLGCKRSKGTCVLCCSGGRQCGCSLALTKISGNSAGILRARVSERFRKFPWKFATANGGRVVHHYGNSQTTQLDARLDQPTCPALF